MKIFSLAVLLSLAGNVFAQHKVIKEGHRGCRGLMPENTISAMKKALDLGADVLELDVVISKDKKVVVSHDPFMSAEFSLKPSGDPVSADEQKNIILYSMPYAEIKKYDVGSKHNPHFPEQQNFKEHKPLLSELVDAVDKYAKEKGLPMPNYNIEIKSDPKTDGLHQPEPKEFVNLVMKVCRSRKILNRMNIQSFDVRPLQIIHNMDKTIKIAYLTSNDKSIEENLKDLGFIPHIYSPHYKKVDKAAVEFCHKQNMQIIPWTVNTKEEIDALVQLGVDGIITDYPNLF